jgi:phospholipase/lecithinase/hemolysin
MMVDKSVILITKTKKGIFMQNIMIRFIFLLAVLFPTLAPAMSVNNIFVFGDSLSDGGNVYNVTGSSFPPPPYAQRFSNGPVAVEQLASMAGINLLPSTLGGTNFAFGGAATGVVAGTANIDNYLAAPPASPLAFLNGTGIQNQTNQFIASGINFDPNQTLFVLWGGPNDIFTWLDGYSSETINQVVAGAIDHIVESIKALYTDGAEYFLIPDMVDLGKTPFGKNQGSGGQAFLSQISSSFNTFLGQKLDAIVGPNIFRPDVNNLLQLVQANPLAYGFDNAIDACLNTAAATLCQNPDRYLFWDGVHPTKQGHALIAGEFYSSAIPEPPVIVLMSLAIVVGFSFGTPSFRMHNIFIVKRMDDGSNKNA